MSVPTQYLYVRWILSHLAPMNEQSHAHKHIEHVSIAYFSKHAPRNGRRTSRQLTLGGVWLELGEINNFLNEMSNITSILSWGVDFHWDNRSLVEEYKRQSWKNFEFTCMYIFFNIYYSDLKLEHSFVYSTYKSLYQIITSGAPFSSLCLTGVQHLKLQWRTSKTDIPHCRMGGGVLRELCWFHVQYGMSII